MGQFSVKIWGATGSLLSGNQQIKMAMRWTGASERTVKYWFAGERGPSGDHLIALVRHSDAVLYVVLALAGRHIVDDADG